MGRITLRLPDHLHLQLQGRSRRSGISLNETIVSTLALVVGNEDEGDPIDQALVEAALEDAVQPRLGIVRLLQLLREIWLERQRQVVVGRRSLALGEEIFRKVAQEATLLAEVTAKQLEVERLGGAARTWERIGMALDAPLDEATVERMLGDAMKAANEADLELEETERNSLTTDRSYDWQPAPTEQRP